MLPRSRRFSRSQTSRPSGASRRAGPAEEGRPGRLLGALQPAHQGAARPGRNRLVGEKTSQIGPQIRGRAIALPGLLLQAFQTDGLEIGGNLLAPRAWWLDLAVEGFVQGLGRRFATVGRLPHQQRVENRSETVDISGTVVGLTIQSLGWNEPRRPEHIAGEREPGLRDRRGIVDLRQAEIGSRVSIPSFLQEAESNVTGSAGETLHYRKTACHTSCDRPSRP